MTKKRSPEPYTNSIEAPTYQSASYYFDDASHVKAGLHDLTSPAGRYGRYSNPTWLEVEGRVSELCGGENSPLFAFGIAAPFTTFISLLGGRALGVVPPPYNPHFAD